MTTAVIIFSLLSAFLLWRLWKKIVTLDDMKMLDNRDEMRQLSSDDWKNGRISDEVGHTLMFVFHRDFKNFFDYVPPERREYTSQMQKLDSSFWKHYRLRPDFVLPADMVYQLYKAYIIEHKDEYPAISQR